MQNLFSWAHPVRSIGAAILAFSVMIAGVYLIVGLSFLLCLAIGGNC